MATQPAILGSMRLGNARLGYAPAALTAIRRTRARVTLSGVETRTAGAAQRVRMASFAIHDAINDAPNTCTVTVNGVAPTLAQALRVSVNSDDPVLLFDGGLQTVDGSYEGLPAQVAYPCTAIDDLQQLNRHRPFGTWTSVSATTVAQWLVATYAPGFSAAGIALGLPAVSVNWDGSEGFGGAFAQLARLIGGAFKVEDRVVSFFQDDATDPPDDIDDTPGRVLDDPPITLSEDNSQLQTRVFGKGHGETVLADVVAGETILPVSNVNAWFGASGGSVISKTQRLTYTGKTQASPTTAPGVALAVGGSLTAGAHQWAYTYETAAGETLPSLLSVAKTAIAAYTPPTPAAPVVAVYGVLSNFTSATLVVGSSYTYKAIYMDATQTAISLQGAASNAVVAVVSSNDPARARALSVFFGPVPTDPLIAFVQFFRSENGGAYTSAGSAFGVSPGSGGGQQYADYGFTGGAAYAGSVAQAFATVNLSGIANGPAGTTSKKVYQTPSGGSQLKLMATIADNVTTTIAATAADGSLGANAPTVDTSGLVLNAVTTTSGATAAGAIVLNLASGAAFLSAGGWGTVAGLPFRYTGKATNQLTGIPASGPGSITAAIPAASTVTTLPTLLGIPASGAGSVGVPLSAGDPVNIWVQRDDLAAQAEQALIDVANGRVPADGIYEGPPVVDERRNEASLTALCDATLQLFSRPIRTVTYACRDLKTKSGKAVHIHVTTPPIGPFDLTIQAVDIDQVDVAPGVAPRFRVTASSVRITLDALLRKLLAAAAA